MNFERRDAGAETQQLEAAERARAREHDRVRVSEDADDVDEFDLEDDGDDEEKGFKS